ncbi:MAG: phosphoribosylformylglycinamidine synthase subunit PurQ [Chitinophagaceae bacterium]
MNRLIFLGEVTSENIIINNIVVDIEQALQASMNTFEDIYPTKINNTSLLELPALRLDSKVPIFKYSLSTSPQVLLPIFPGKNCDYDMARAFGNEGALIDFLIFRNRRKEDVEQSINSLAEAIEHTHILVLSGGFSAGDEPDGSGKFIANVLNNQRISESIQNLLQRGGLIFGVCKGFQALIKSGLLTYGKTGSISEKSPTLFRNDINRHISLMANVRVSSIQSPWLSSFTIGQINTLPMSHGEGKFVVSDKDSKALFENGQVAFQYCDFEGHPTMNGLYNPNGSCYAIEGIISRCSQILGRMGHCEHMEQNLLKNIQGNRYQNIFKNAINYFK